MAKAPINVQIEGDYNDKDIKRVMRDLESLQKQSKTMSSCRINVHSGRHLVFSQSIKKQRGILNRYRIIVHGMQ